MCGLVANKEFVESNNTSFITATFEKDKRRKGEIVNLRRFEELEVSTEPLFEDLDTPDELPPVEWVDIEVKEYQVKS